MPDKTSDPHEFQDALETIKPEFGPSTLQYPSQEIYGNVDVLNIFEGQYV